METVAKYALNMASTVEISHITLAQNMKGKWYIHALFFVLVVGDTHSIHLHLFSLDQLWQTEPPAIKDSYVISLSAECLSGIVNAMYPLFAFFDLHLAPSPLLPLPPSPP